MVSAEGKKEVGQFIEKALYSLISAGLSALIVVGGLQKDIEWIKQSLANQSFRIAKVEERLWSKHHEPVKP